MAVGVSCAGTGLHEAQSVLEPLLKDSVDFVRQGALLALALVLMQQPEKRLESFRAHLEKTLADKHEEVMCRMGAIMATGMSSWSGVGGHVVTHIHTHTCVYVCVLLLVSTTMRTCVVTSLFAACTHECRWHTYVGRLLCNRSSILRTAITTRYSRCRWAQRHRRPTCPLWLLSPHHHRWPGHVYAILVLVSTVLLPVHVAAGKRVCGRQRLATAATLRAALRLLSQPVCLPSGSAAGSQHAGSQDADCCAVHHCTSQGKGISRGVVSRVCCQGCVSLSVMQARKKDAIKAAKAGTESKAEAMDTADAVAVTGEEAAPAAPTVPEPTNYTLENPCRVVPAQERYVRRITSSRCGVFANYTSVFCYLQPRMMADTCR